MQKLFENWRKYLIEVDTDNDGIDDEKELAIIDKGELEPQEQETSDEQKIFNAFLDNGVHGLHLAEMTGSPIVGDLKEVVQDVHSYIAIIEDPAADPQKLANSLDWWTTSIGSGIYAAGEKALIDEDEIRTIVDDFEEMVVEAGDYVWWHGKYANKAPRFNVASKERSAALLSDLKEWAGV
tara:strand:+ start:502 stop:1044 length:543 start_codon:yes stop_codon:yes gene_type:complete